MESASVSLASLRPESLVRCSPQVDGIPRAQRIPPPPSRLVLLHTDIVVRPSTLGGFHPTRLSTPQGLLRMNTLPRWFCIPLPHVVRSITKFRTRQSQQNLLNYYSDKIVRRDGRSALFADGVKAASPVLLKCYRSFNSTPRRLPYVLRPLAVALSAFAPSFEQAR